MKDFKQTTKTTWRGITRLFHTIEDLTTGLSAIAVMAMAVAYALQHKAHHALFYAMLLAVVVMGIVAAQALGRYLNKIGKEMEQ